MNIRNVVKKIKAESIINGIRAANWNREPEDREQGLYQSLIPSPKSLIRRSGASSVRAKVVKGVWRMPRLSQAMKDVISCDNPRGGANDL